jgi:hypothetical protein
MSAYERISLFLVVPISPKIKPKYPDVHLTMRREKCQRHTTTHTAVILGVSIKDAGRQRLTVKERVEKLNLL